MKKTLLTIASCIAAVSLAFAQGPGGPGGGPGGGPNGGPALNQPVPNPGGPNGGPGGGSLGGGPFGGGILNNPAPAPQPLAPAPAPAPAPPSNALQCILGGVTYWLANGLYYTLTSNGGYTTTSTPPIGLIVPRLNSPIQISWAGYPAYLSNHVVYRPIWTAAGREFKVVGYLG